MINLPRFSPWFLTRPRARLTLFVALIFLTPALPSRAAVFYPTSYTLDNGLELVVVPNHLAPAVTQMVWYKVGSTDEVAGKTGLAHYLEHLMFRGTDQIGPGVFSKEIAALGGNENAFTSYDYTAFHETIAAEHLRKVMEMEADRMQNLHITSATATPELQVVLNERHQRTDNSPVGRFEEKQRRILLPHSPYGVPVIGWRPEIEKLSVADAQAFYHKHYAPNNAVVVITGDVEPDAVKQLADEIYGSIPRKDVPARGTLPVINPPAQAVFSMKDAGVEQAQVQMDIIVPSYATQKSQEAYALEVLTEALDGGEVGALYRDLVKKQNIAAGVDADYDPDTRGDTIMTIALTPRAGVKTAKLEAALQAELAALAKNGLSEREVEQAKQRMTRSATFARDSIITPGYVFGMALATGHSVEDVEAWPDRIGAVHATDVNQALRTLVASKLKLLSALQPDESATAAQREAARPTVSHDMSIR